MTDVLMKVTDLTRRFQGKVAVNGISFDILRGECLGLLGPNGAGKTTTVEMLEGLLPPCGGSIAFEGHPLDSHYKQQIGIQFQETALPDYLTVQNVLGLFANLYQDGLPLEQVIETCALAPLLTQQHKTLSGGQKQRLLLALALVNDPQLIFLDEPTTGLDPAARRHFWDLVNSLKENGKTLLLTTHYMDEAEQLCDRLLIMDQGEIIARGTPGDLLSSHYQGQVISLADNPLEVLPGWRERVGRRGRGWELTSRQVAEDIQVLIQAGGSLSGLSVRSPTLEDLFIRLTGHQLRG